MVASLARPEKLSRGQWRKPGMTPGGAARASSSRRPAAGGLILVQRDRCRVPAETPAIPLKGPRFRPHRSPICLAALRCVLAFSRAVRHGSPAGTQGGAMGLSQPARPESSSLVSIQELRAIAALLVFWGHAMHAVRGGGA